MNNNGFTLIELLIIMLLLSVLSVIAIPRYLSVSDQAHTSTFKGVSASLASAIHMVNLRWHVEGGTGSSVDLGAGVVVPVTEKGWPGKFPSTAKACKEVWDKVLVLSPKANTGYIRNSEGFGIIARTYHCYYVYQPVSSPIHYVEYNVLTGEVKNYPK